MGLVDARVQGEHGGHGARVRRGLTSPESMARQQGVSAFGGTGAPEGLGLVRDVQQVCGNGECGGGSGGSLGWLPRQNLVGEKLGQHGEGELAAEQPDGERRRGMGRNEEEGEGIYRGMVAGAGSHGGRAEWAMWPCVRAVVRGRRGRAVGGQGRP